MKKRNIIYAVFVMLMIVCVFCSFVACESEQIEDPQDNNTTTNLHPHSEGAVYSYGDFEAQHDRAILFLPGLMASAMFSNDSAHVNTWGYAFFFSTVGELLSAASDKNLTTSDKQAKLDSILKKIACDEDSVPYTIQAIANMSDDYPYDAFDGMSYSYNVLEPYYKDTHDLIVWQYDWRQSVSGAAEELESFINYYGYKEVCFVTHSLGGAVIAQYLARSEANREKTALFVPFAAPFFGSFDAVSYLFTRQHDDNYKYPTLEDYNVNEVVSTLLSGSDPDVQPIEFGSALINYMMGSEFAITDLTRNMASVYQMLPCCSALVNTPYYDPNSGTYVGVNTPYVLAEQSIFTNSGLLDYLNGLGWTHRADGALKPAVSTLNNYYDSLFFTNDKGERVFVTELVTTEYIVGINCSTTVAVKLDAKGQIVETIDSDLGDYTIPAYSASAGLPLDHPRVHTVDKSHNYIANDTADHPAEETGIQFLLDIFERNIG